MQNGVFHDNTFAFISCISSLFLLISTNFRTWSLPQPSSMRRSYNGDIMLVGCAQTSGLLLQPQKLSTPKNFSFPWVLSVDHYHIRDYNWEISETQNKRAHIPLAINAIKSPHKVMPLETPPYAPDWSWGAIQCYCGDSSDPVGPRWKDPENP